MITSVKRSVGDGAVPESASIPADLMGAPGQRTETEAALAIVNGLTAVGSTLGEALGSLAASTPLDVVIEVSGLLTDGDIARMRVLFEAQDHLEDKAAFGQACLRAGFSPVGVALCALDSKRGIRAGASMNACIKEAKRLIQAMGVDVGMANAVSRYMLYLQQEDVLAVTSANVVLPCNVMFSGVSGEIDWLTAAGSIAFDVSKGPVSFPRLVEVEKVLRADEFREGNLNVPKLVMVGKELNVRFSEGLSFPSLRCVGDLEAYLTVDLKLPLLQKIDGRLTLQDAKGFAAPSVEVVVGNIDGYNACDTCLSSLKEVKGSLIIAGANNFSAPSLVAVGERVISENAVGVDLGEFKLLSGKRRSRS